MLRSLLKSWICKFQNFNVRICCRPINAHVFLHLNELDGRDCHDIFWVSSMVRQLLPSSTSGSSESPHLDNVGSSQGPLIEFSITFCLTRSVCSVARLPNFSLVDFCIPMSNKSSCKCKYIHQVHRRLDPNFFLNDCCEIFLLWVARKVGLRPHHT